MEALKQKVSNIFSLIFVMAICVMASCLLPSYAGNLIAADNFSPNDWLPPVAATATDGSTVYVAQFEPGKILRLSSATLNKGPNALEPCIDTTATHIIDMQVSQTTNELVMICDQPPRLVRQPLNAGQATIVPLPSKPARIALAEPSDGKQHVCVTMPWSKSVWIGVLSGSSDMDNSQPMLSFLPKEVLALDESRFLLADALTNELAILDAPIRRVIHKPKLNGYHISGLAIDRSSARLLVSNQVLSTNAHSDKDDIRWGNLIQNNVSSIALGVADEKKRSMSEVSYRLGNFGHGSADPAGIVSLGDRFAVAISGTNEVAIYNKPKHQAKYVAVGRVPDRLWRLGEDRLVCLHRLDARIAVINCAGDQPRLEAMIGQDRLPQTAAQRGELAFFSGHLSHDGWMSCQSCHIDGHSPDLLVDTQGDGSFDSPKKIPALGNVAHTGPWSWRGSQHTLREQIIKTLTSTMHMPDELPAGAGLQQPTVAEDLVEYLAGIADHTSLPETAPLDSDVAKAMVAGGEALFQQHCARCHDPDQHFTTPKSYDIGLNDERGHKLFNPPSLNGLRYRKLYMHDGRYRELDQVLTNHPQPAFKFTEEELLQLKSYLKRQ